MLLPLAEDTEPFVVEADEIGEGIVRSAVPDLLDLDEFSRDTVRMFKGDSDKAGYRL